MTTRSDSLDLVFERRIDLVPELVWAAWTTPEIVTEWFTPAPWKTVACEINLVPGGVFRTVMLSPEGVEHVNEGCYLEVVPGSRLVWTNALDAGFRPRAAALAQKADMGFHFTAMLTLRREGGGTLYGARVLHADVASRDTHAAMGFESGWSAALEQLVAAMRSRSKR